MKYSSEELYNWCLENEQKQAAIEALYFNNRGLIVRPLKGELVKKENQFYYVANVGPGFDVNEPMGDGSEQQNKLLDKIKLHPEVMETNIIAYDRRYRLRFAFAEKEEDRKEQLHKTLIIDMFDLLGIDTVGKAKKFLDESQESKASKQAFNMIGQRMKNMKKREEEMNDQ
ncbi:MAG: hypothetical protein Q4E53_06775 [Eubacteriales bacterium]|nr:hypothetical protein [Eubacteriales bacterium]